jgi:hypothetical protein
MYGGENRKIRKLGLLLNSGEGGRHIRPGPTIRSTSI